MSAAGSINSSTPPPSSPSASSISSFSGNIPMKGISFPAQRQNYSFGDKSEAGSASMAGSYLDDQITAGSIETSTPGSASASSASSAGFSEWTFPSSMPTKESFSADGPKQSFSVFSRKPETTEDGDSMLTE